MLRTRDGAAHMIVLWLSSENMGVWMCVFLNRWESERFTALIVFHVRLMRSNSPWAAICLSFSTQSGSGQWPGGQTSTWCGAAPGSWTMGSWKLGRVLGSVTFSFVTFVFFYLLFLMILSIFISACENRFIRFHTCGSIHVLCLFLLYRIFFRTRLWIRSPSSEATRISIYSDNKDLGAKQSSLSHTHQARLSWKNPCLKNWGSCSSYWIICESC